MLSSLSHWWLSLRHKVCTVAVRCQSDTLRLDMGHMTPVRLRLGRFLPSMVYMFLLQFRLTGRTSPERRLCMTHARGGCSRYPQGTSHMWWSRGRAEPSQVDMASSLQSRWRC
jgi:hypothetical protein